MANRIVYVDDENFDHLCECLAVANNTYYVTLNEPRVIFMRKEREMNKDDREKFREALADLEAYDKFNYPELRKEEKEMSTKQVMTRADAINFMHAIFGNILQAERMVDFYIAAGMMEVKEENKKLVQKLCFYERIDLGVIRVEEWTEGLVLWVSGELKWKSWNDAVQ